MKSFCIHTMLCNSRLISAKPPMSHLNLLALSQGMAAVLGGTFGAVIFCIILVAVVIYLRKTKG